MEPVIGIKEALIHLPLSDNFSLKDIVDDKNVKEVLSNLGYSSMAYERSYFNSESNPNIRFGTEKYGKTVFMEKVTPFDERHVTVERITYYRKPDRINWVSGSQCFDLSNWGIYEKKKPEFHEAFMREE